MVIFHITVSVTRLCWGYNGWPSTCVSLIVQGPLTVSALPQWEPTIQLPLLCTSLWVSRSHGKTRRRVRVASYLWDVICVNLWKIITASGFSFNVHAHVVTKQGVAFYKSTWCVLTGDSQPMDVCSVHHNDLFLRYSVSLLGYGFYGDVLTDSERKRWMGPARYDLSGMRAIIF